MQSSVCCPSECTFPWLQGVVADFYGSLHKRFLRSRFMMSKLATAGIWGQLTAFFADAKVSFSVDAEVAQW